MVEGEHEWKYPKELTSLSRSNFVSFASEALQSDWEWVVEADKKDR